MVDEDEEIDVSFNAPFESDYAKAKKREDLGDITSFGNTFVRVIISGLKLSSGGPDIIRNASSTVVAVENGEWSVILPGDATYHTMAEVNGFYKKWGTKPLIPTVFMLEIPHHGALRTAVENYTAKTPLAELDFSIITAFATYLAPQEVVASAGPRNNHAHPVKEVIDVFVPTLSTSYSRNYVAYVFDKKKSKKVEGWEQFSTTKGIRTTVFQIEGTVLYGNLFYNIRDSTALTREVPEFEFEPLGTLDDLVARYGEAAANDPWLRDAMAGRTAAPRDEILRAPPPTSERDAG